MVKMKGFTLIEFMVVIAIIAILIMFVSAGLSNCKKKKAKLNNNETIEELVNVEALDAPMEYIRRDLRTSEQMTLKRHDDGSLWSCFVTTETCHMVTE